jgi:hypothetical protein
LRTSVRYLQYDKYEKSRQNISEVPVRWLVLEEFRAATDSLLTIRSSLLSCLPESVAQLSVPTCLLRESSSSPAAVDSLERVQKLEILRLAVRCYSRAIHGDKKEKEKTSSSSSCWSLWHQLGLAFSSLARYRYHFSQIVSPISFVMFEFLKKVVKLVFYVTLVIDENHLH